MKLKTYLCAGAAFCSLSLAGSTAAAVDFAFCKGGFEATDLHCFQQSQYGDNIPMVEKSVGEMYNRGWTVISVYLTELACRPTPRKIQRLCCIITSKNNAQ
jgi:hypothetical protein